MTKYDYIFKSEVTVYYTSDNPSDEVLGQTDHWLTEAFSLLPEVAVAMIQSRIDKWYGPGTIIIKLPPGRVDGAIAVTARGDTSAEASSEMADEE